MLTSKESGIVFRNSEKERYNNQSAYFLKFRNLKILMGKGEAYSPPGGRAGCH